MKKISWDFYNQRTGKSLESILGDIRSIDNAKKKLDRMGLQAPPDDVIQTALDRLRKRDKQKEEAQTLLKVPRAKKTAPRRTQKKGKSSGKRSSVEKNKATEDDAENIDLLATNKTQANVKNEKYFRRVVPAKKTRN
jgi:hypothetical protein